MWGFKFLRTKDSDKYEIFEFHLDKFSIIYSETKKPNFIIEEPFDSSKSHNINTKV